MKKPLTPLAKKLRHYQTDQERKLWNILRIYRLGVIPAPEPESSKLISFIFFGFPESFRGCGMTIFLSYQLRRCICKDQCFVLIAPPPPPPPPPPRGGAK